MRTLLTATHNVYVDLRARRDALVQRDQEIMSLKRSLRNAREELEAANGDEHDAVGTCYLSVRVLCGLFRCLPSRGFCCMHWFMFAGSMRKSVEALQAENQRVRAQVAEMESFLNDYGLVWVGSQADAPDGAAAGGRIGGGDVQPGGRDNAAVVGRLRELNALAGDGKKRVSNVGGASKLVDGERLKVALFGNGFMLRRGPFRTYDLESSQAFFKDVLDGYFPFELKGAFPDGVAFDISNTPEKQYSGPGVNAAGELVTITASASSSSDAKGSAASVSMPGAGRKLVADDEVGASGLAKHGWARPVACGRMG